MTSLEFDYDILSLEDVLYCPNLEKELGKHRYLLNDESMLQMYGDDWCSVVSDLEKSEFVLKVAQELKGLKIERWHKHYFPATTTLDITEMGIPEVPADLNYLSTSGWTIAHSQEGNVSEQFPLKNLLDNNSATIWMPLSHTVLLSYDITIDMQAEQTINGIKIVQAGMESALGFLPGSVQIEVSNDGYEWEMFAHVQDIALGNGFGEAMVYRLNEPRQARYIKVSVSDRLTGVMNVALGDIAVF
ncbi:MAG: discoidin domain-containing protein [Butyricimonas faecihominis]